jgi:hypothetical protein
MMGRWFVGSESQNKEMYGGMTFDGECQVAKNTFHSLQWHSGNFVFMGERPEAVQYTQLPPPVPGIGLPILPIDPSLSCMRTSQIPTPSVSEEGRDS